MCPEKEIYTIHIFEFSQIIKDVFFPMLFFHNLYQIVIPHMGGVECIPHVI